MEKRKVGLLFGFTNGAPNGLVRTLPLGEEKFGGVRLRDLFNIKPEQGLLVTFRVRANGRPTKVMLPAKEDLEAFTRIEGTVLGFNLKKNSGLIVDDGGTKYLFRECDLAVDSLFEDQRVRFIPVQCGDKNHAKFIELAGASLVLEELNRDEEAA